MEGLIIQKPFRTWKNKSRYAANCTIIFLLLCNCFYHVVRIPSPIPVVQLHDFAFALVFKQFQRLWIWTVFIYICSLSLHIISLLFVAKPHLSIIHFACSDTFTNTFSYQILVEHLHTRAWF